MNGTTPAEDVFNTPKDFINEVDRMTEIKRVVDSTEIEDRIKEIFEKLTNTLKNLKNKEEATTFTKEIIAIIDKRTKDAFKFIDNVQKLSVHIDTETRKKFLAEKHEIDKSSEKRTRGSGQVVDKSFIENNNATIKDLKTKYYKSIRDSDENNNTNMFNELKKQLNEMCVYDTEINRLREFELPEPTVVGSKWSEKMSYKVLHKYPRDTRVYIYIFQFLSPMIRVMKEIKESNVYDPASTPTGDPPTGDPPTDDQSTGGPSTGGKRRRTRRRNRKSKQSKRKSRNKRRKSNR